MIDGLSERQNDFRRPYTTDGAITGDGNEVDIIPKRVARLIHWGVGEAKERDKVLT